MGIGDVVSPPILIPGGSLVRILGCKGSPGGVLAGNESLEMVMPGGKFGSWEDLLLSSPFDREGVREIPPRFASLSWTWC